MKPSTLSPAQFMAWRRNSGMSIGACARRLGISPSSINLYEAGERYDKPVIIPLLVCLGISAINNNLQPYDGESNDSDTANSSDHKSTRGIGISEQLGK